MKHIVTCQVTMRFLIDTVYEEGMAADIDAIL